LYGGNMSERECPTVVLAGGASQLRVDAMQLQVKQVKRSEPAVHAPAAK